MAYIQHKKHDRKKRGHWSAWSAVAEALAGGILFPIFLQGRGRGFVRLYSFADVLLMSPGFVLSSLDDVAVIRFVNHQGYCIDNVLLNSHIYGQPCIEPVANYFFLTIR